MLIVKLCKKIGNNYSTMSLPAKASVWFVFCGVIQKGIAFITTPIFTRLLTQSEYGSVSVYFSWMSIISIIASLELGTGVFNKAMIRFEKDRDGYTSSTLLLASLSTVCCCVLAMVINHLFPEYIGMSNYLIFLMFVDIFFTNAITMWTVRERFEYKYKNVVYATILSNFLATMVSLIFVLKLHLPNDIARIKGMVLMHAICYGIIYIYIFTKGKRGYKKKYWDYALKYNLPLIPHYMSQQVLSQSDRIMINSLCGAQKAAVYSLSYQIAIVMNLVTNSIHASFMPWTFQRIKDGNVQTIGKRSLQIELIIGIMCLLFSLFAPEFVLLMGGKTYFSAVYIVPPVATSVLFITLYSFYGNIEFYFEKTKIVMYASILTAFINIILNYVFINLYGYIAAGYTTLFCYIIYAAIHYIFMKKICIENEFKNPYNGKVMWSIALIFAFLSIFISLLYNSFIIRYILILCLVLIGGYFYYHSIIKS